MAVFKQELSWSTYQDKQLKTLESIERSFSTSLKTSTLVRDSLSSIARAVDIIATELNKNFRSSVQGAADTFTRSANNMAGSMSRQAVIYDQHGNVLQRVTSATEEYNRALDEAITAERKRLQEEEEARKKQEQDVEEFGENLKHKFMEILDSLGKSADNYSTLTNSLMQYTGLDKESAQDFRSDLVHGIVADLNSETGYHYNAQEVYSQMIAIANQSSIGSAKTLKEITRPVMLAVESMDIHMGDLSTLLGRWHTRYNFSSVAMESMVDDIRSSSAGNQASAQATLENIMKLDNWMAFYSGGDTETLNKMTEEISNASAWLESMGVDTSRYTDYLADIASGSAATNTQLVSILGKSGMTAMDAQELFAQGELSKIYEALFQGEVAMLDQIKSNGSLYGQSADAYGLDINNILDASNAAYSDNYKSLEEFIRDIDPTTAVESVEKQYVSATDKTNNLLSGISTILSNWQESWGVGLSDALKVITIGLGVTGGAAGLASIVKGSSGILGKIGSLIGLGGSGAAAGAGGSILASLGSLATKAVPILGGVVALTAVAKGIAEDVKKTREASKVEAETISSQTSADTLSQLSVDEVWNKETGATEFVASRDAVSNKDFDLQKELENIDLKYEHDENYSWVSDIIGTTSLHKNREKNFVTFLSRLSADQKAVYNAYDEFGAFRDSRDFHIQTEFIKNFDKIYRSYYADTPQVYTIKDNIFGWPYFQMDDPKDRKQLWGYETGSNYITSNQLAFLHEGEAVVPKKYNPTANITELEALREQAKSKSDREVAQYQETLSKTVSTLVEIKEFLSEWKTHNDRKDVKNTARNKFESASRRLASYTLE